MDIFTGNGRHIFEQAYDASVVIYFHLLITGLSMQFIFVIALNTLLTDIVIGGVVLSLTLLIQSFQVVVIDFET